VVVVAGCWGERHVAASGVELWPGGLVEDVGDEGRLGCLFDEEHGVGDEGGAGSSQSGCLSASISTVRSSGLGRGATGPPRRGWLRGGCRACAERRRGSYWGVFGRQYRTVSGFSEVAAHVVRSSGKRVAGSMQGEDCLALGSYPCQRVDTATLLGNDRPVVCVPACLDLPSCGPSGVVRWARGRRSLCSGLRSGRAPRRLSSEASGPGGARAASSWAVAAVRSAPPTPPGPAGSHVSPSQIGRSPWRSTRHGSQGHHLAVKLRSSGAVRRQCVSGQSRCTVRARGARSRGEGVPFGMANGIRIALGEGTCGGDPCEPTHARPMGSGCVVRARGYTRKRTPPNESGG